jgi:cytoskeletal protein CcmA (bactofilin family)
MSNIHDIRNGLKALSDAIDALQSNPVPKPEILDRELSGNKINGGVITNFQSAGIVDEARETVLTVTSQGIAVKNINVENINNPVTVKGALTVEGEITANRLHVEEISADVRNERSTPLEFRAENNSLGGKGLIWTGVDYTKQFVYKHAPDRLWSSEDIDIDREKCFRIDALPVLNLTSLGDSVTQSNLQSVGTLESLNVDGSVTIDNFVHYDANSQRLGVGTAEPNGMVSIKSYDHEFTIDETEDKQFKVGTYTTTGLKIITDDTDRITINAGGDIELKNKVTVRGKLGVNVNNFSDDVDITTSGPIRIQGKKFETGTNPPDSGSYIQGDIIWNTNPIPTGYVGWICVRSGNPGEWKPFGQIQN